MANIILVLCLLTVPLAILGEQISITVEHRFGTSEIWKKRGTFSVVLNPENKKYKLENVEDDFKADLEAGKKALDVETFLCFHFQSGSKKQPTQTACSIGDVYSLRLLQSARTIATTSVSAV